MQIGVGRKWLVKGMGFRVVKKKNQAIPSSIIMTSYLSYGGLLIMSHDGEGFLVSVGRASERVMSAFLPG